MSLLLAVAVVCSTPAASARMAVADAETLPAIVRGQTRYLSLYHVPPRARSEMVAAVDYLLNAVSRSRTIVRSRPLADGSLVRLDLAAYADARRPETYQELVEAWEQLAAEDPYFHIRTQVATTRGLETVTTDGGWIGLDTARRLREQTGSLGAVLRADWFVAQVTRTPAYYQWSGVPPREAEFYGSLGLDLRTINTLAADSAANLFRSAVTGKPRRIIFRPGPLGGNWVTKDVAQESPERDPVRNPVDYLEQQFRFDASEVFYSRPNRFWGTALFDANGRRQDAVPVAIATDTTAPGGRQELVPLISCIRCHELAGGAGGLQPFDDDQTRLPRPRSGERAVEQRIAELYDPARLAKQIARDREDYAEAVAAATGGLEPAEAAAALAGVYARHVDEPISAGAAAAELGLQVEELAPALSDSRDPITLAVVLRRAVGRRSWEASFQDAVLLAESYRAARQALNAAPGDNPW